LRIDLWKKVSPVRLSLKDHAENAGESDAVGQIVGLSPEDVFEDGAGRDDNADDLQEMSDQLAEIASFKRDVKNSVPAVKKQVAKTPAETASEHVASLEDLADDIADAHIVDSLQEAARDCGLAGVAAGGSAPSAMNPEDNA